MEDNRRSHRERTIEAAPFATLRSGSLLSHYAQSCVMTAPITVLR
jgi:hypothetical protein